MNALPSGVTNGDIGLLEGTGSIACGGVNRSPPAGSAAFAPPPAGADDCTCSCCDAASCPAYTHGMFYAGASAGCTAAACSAHFYFCPDAGAHTTGSRVTAKYGDNRLDTRLVGSQVRCEPEPSRKPLLTLIPSIAHVAGSHLATTTLRASRRASPLPGWLVGLRSARMVGQGLQRTDTQRVARLSSTCSCQCGLIAASRHGARFSRSTNMNGSLQRPTGQSPSRRDWWMTLGLLATLASSRRLGV